MRLLRTFARIPNACELLDLLLEEVCHCLQTNGINAWITDKRVSKSMTSSLPPIPDGWGAFLIYHFSGP